MKTVSQRTWIATAVAPPSSACRPPPLPRTPPQPPRRHPPRNPHPQRNRTATTPGATRNAMPTAWSA